VDQFWGGRSGAILDIDLLGGFNPVGHTFVIMTWDGTLSGMFHNAQDDFQMDGYNWTIAYNSNDIVLNGVSPVSTVPLPGSVWLLLTGLTGLLGVRRFRLRLRGKHLWRRGPARASSSFYGWGQAR
jgi:hypothetical protein